MYHKSPSLYKVMDEAGILKLPSKTTLMRHSPEVGGKPGFHANVFQKILNDFKKLRLDPHNEYFTLVVDEMKIYDDIVYRVESGEMVGFTNLNDVQNKMMDLQSETFEEKPLASHVLQFMIRGITSSYKYPFAHFATKSLTAESLDSLIFEAVCKLELCGVKIKCVVGDGASTNRKCFGMNGGEKNYKCENPFATDDRDLYFIFDVPHLLKTVRNCLFHSSEGCKYRLMNINGENLLWDTIRLLYRKDVEKSGSLRKLHKLTADHINVENKMKVKLATQVLSQTVANSLKQEFPNQYPETVRFIETFNKWFDIMNVGQLLEGIHSRNPNLHPFHSKDDPRLAWLKNEFLGYLEEWENYVEGLPESRPTKNKMMLSRETLSGLRQTTNAILEMIPFLLEKGAKFVLTAHFNQDPLEQYFSKQRQACKAGSQPRLYQYSRTTRVLQNLQEGRIMLRNVKGGNTE